jgi:hypothetical protein
MYLIDLTNVVYRGYDINDLAIERNKQYHPEWNFFEIDLVNEILPKADLIICRDCLFHLSNDFVLRAIKNFRDSGSTYLLATEHRWLKVNVDLNKEELEREAGFRQINIEIAPYNMGLPIEIHNEELWASREGGNRQMSLWKLK